MRLKSLWPVASRDLLAHLRFDVAQFVYEQRANLVIAVSMWRNSKERGIMAWCVDGYTGGLWVAGETHPKINGERQIIPGIVAGLDKVILGEWHRNRRCNRIVNAGMDLEWMDINERFHSVDSDAAKSI